MASIRFFATVFVLLALAGDARVAAQQDANGDPVNRRGTTVTLPRLAPATISTTVSVPDGGTFMSGVVIRPADRLKNPYYPKRDKQGGLVFQFLHEQKPWKIVINPDESIDITIVEHFDENNLDELRRLHPQIYKSYDNFPKKSGGSSKVRLKLDIETTISAMNEAQLEHLYPEIHQVYSRHVNQANRAGKVDDATLFGPVRIQVLDEITEIKIGSSDDNR